MKYYTFFKHKLFIKTQEKTEVSKSFQWVVPDFVVVYTSVAKGIKKVNILCVLFQLPDYCLYLIKFFLP